MTTLLTIFSLLIIFIALMFAGGMYLAIRHRPQINIPPVKVEFILPPALRFVQLTEEAPAPTVDPMPPEIFDYCNAESEQSARDARMRRARTLRSELGSWAAAFRALVLEDSN